MSPTNSQKALSFLPLGPVVSLILLTLGEEPRHGYGIMVAVKERSDGRVDLGTSHLYRHLKRLLDDGLVNETSHSASDGRDDKRRRYYRLTPLGKTVLAAEATRMTKLVERTRAIGVLGR